MSAQPMYRRGQKVQVGRKDGVIIYASPFGAGFGPSYTVQFEDGRKAVYNEGEVWPR